MVAVMLGKEIKEGNLKAPDGALSREERLSKGLFSG